MNAQSRRLTKGRNVLSFDLGNKNFSYVFEEQTSDAGAVPLTVRIVAWCNMDLLGTTIEVLTSNVIRALDQRPWMLLSDNVVVEGQVAQNVEMKVLSHVLQTYFYTRCNVFNNFIEAVEQGRQPTANAYILGPVFSFATASSKFKYLDSALEVVKGDKEDARKFAKRKSVELAKDTLTTMFGANSAELAFLNSHAKQDDLADCFLQGLFQLKLLAHKDKQKKRPRAAPGNVPRRLIDLTGHPVTEATSAAELAEILEERPTNDHWVKRAEEECNPRHVFMAPGARAKLGFLDGSMMSDAHKKIRKPDLQADLDRRVIEGGESDDGDELEVV